MLTETYQPNESFHQILERSLNSNFGSRPPKMEITGILTPIYASPESHRIGYKIINDFDDYLLYLNSQLYQLAHRAEFEEVTVKGYFDHTKKVFTVEKLILRSRSDESSENIKQVESYFDLDNYRKTISKAGYLEPDYGFMVS